MYNHFNSGYYDMSNQYQQSQLGYNNYNFQQQPYYNNYYQYQNNYNQQPINNYVDNSYITVQQQEEVHAEEKFKELINLSGNRIFDRPLRTNENSIINFILDYFNFTLDNNGFICEVMEDNDSEIFVRIKIKNKFINAIEENIKSKNIIYFNPFKNSSIARFIFSIFLEKNDIDIMTFYVSTDNVLFMKDYEGNIVYKSKEYLYNPNLCYLDVFFRLLCMDVDLSSWDVSDYED